MLVPDLGLVTQTYEEFFNCGTTFKLTKWTGKNKPDLTANVIIANIGIIQSRFDDNDWLKYIDLLIVDECHKITAGNKISKIVQQIKTPNKFGFTGTLPEDQLNKWSIIGKLGPVIYEKSSFELRLEDYLTNVSIKILNINYSPRPHFSGQTGYRDELEYIYNNDKRNDIIKSLVSKLSANTLIMVNHIAHGDVIMEYLQKVEGKKAYFIQGSVDVEEREKIKALMERETNIVVVAISAIFATGVNIKNLHNIIFASGGKSFIRTVQSIGRGLRKHDSKDKLIIFDILDAGFFDNLTPIDLTNEAFIRTEQIRDKYLEWHPNAQRFKPVTDKYITSHVMRVFPSAKRDQQRVGVDNRRGLIWPPLDVCRQDFEKYLNCKIPWADASEVPKKHAASVTSVTDESEAAFVNTFDAHQEHISEAEQLQ